MAEDIAGKSPDNQFSSDFWNDDFEIDFESCAGPLYVARMTQANEHVPSDPETFYKNAISISGKFMRLMGKTR
jgi:hypothetical protein